MSVEVLRLDRGRTLLLCSSQEPIEDIEPLAATTFAALLPAFRPPDLARLPAIVEALRELGCIGFSCVGPHAEELHDALDWVLLDRAEDGTVTTWHGDPVDAAEYFLLAVSGDPSLLVALVADHPEVAAALRAQAATASWGPPPPRHPSDCVSLTREPRQMPGLEERPPLRGCIRGNIKDAKLR